MVCCKNTKRISEPVSLKRFQRVGNTWAERVPSEKNTNFCSANDFVCFLSYASDHAIALFSDMPAVALC
jgi:hypothetical protein